MSIQNLEQVRSIVGSSETAQRLLERLASTDVNFDRYGLVMPTKSLRVVNEVVAPDLVEARNRMQEVMLEGKTVIYFPGAFDLVHVGHAAYLLEGIEQVMKRTGLSRDKLFVVVLADSDTLIQAAKPAHKYAMNGGHPRPIESTEVFYHVLANATELNPRVIDLAQLDIDMVGVIPSPNEAHALLTRWIFKNWFRQFSNFEHTGALLLADRGDDISAEAEQTVNDYRALVTAIRNQQYAHVITSFDNVRFGLPSEGEPSCWSLPSWQLLLHRFLGMVHQLPQAGCYRVLSMRDSYSPIVQRLMELSRIMTVSVNDTHLLSTTTLLERVSWSNLYRAKVESFQAWLDK